MGVEDCNAEQFFIVCALISYCQSEVIDFWEFNAILCDKSAFSSKNSWVLLILLPDDNVFMQESRKFKNISLRKIENLKIGRDFSRHNNMCMGEEKLDIQKILAARKVHVLTISREFCWFFCGIIAYLCKRIAHLKNIIIEES